MADDNYGMESRPARGLISGAPAGYSSPDLWAMIKGLPRRVKDAQPERGYQPSGWEEAKMLYGDLFKQPTEDFGYPMQSQGDLLAEADSPFSDPRWAEKSIHMTPPGTIEQPSNYVMANTDDQYQADKTMEASRFWSDVNDSPGMAELPEEEKKSNKNWKGLAGAAAIGLAAMKKGDEDHARWAKMQHQKDIANMWLMATGQGMGAGGPTMKPSQLNPYLQGMATAMQMGQNEAKRSQDNKKISQDQQNMDRWLKIQEAKVGYNTPSGNDFHKGSEPDEPGTSSKEFRGEI